MTASVELPQRLDLLLYAHDGRGLGHASRTLAIAMAVRRLFPALRVLAVTGTARAGDLIGAAPVDWMKLPAYATRVSDGRSTGAAGYSGFDDRALGRLRGALLRDVLGTLRPRLVLADHGPRGKHGELEPALRASAGTDTLWVLGVRAVVGDVPQVWSPLATGAFAAHYDGLLWYGDSAVLGAGELDALEGACGRRPVETGYVSRLVEMAAAELLPPVTEPTLAGTVAVPWQGERTGAVVAALSQALAVLGSQRGAWRVFLEGAPGGGPARAAFEAVAGCSVAAPGAGYVDALRASRVAVVYGGYNSLTDVLACGLPALVLVRDMADDEQRRHVDRLGAALGGRLRVLTEVEAVASRIAAEIDALPIAPPAAPHPVRLDGAARTATHLARLLGAGVARDGPAPELAGAAGGTPPRGA